MTKEQVQARLEKLQTEREQARATLAAYEGAIQDCLYWLQQFDTDETTTSEETK